MGTRRGTSLIDLLISMAIIALLFGGVYLVYFSIVNSVSNIGARTAAASILAQEIETMRNLPYDSVGTVGGVPPGVIPQTQAMSSGNYTFTLTTVVRNIDDPFDGVLGGNPDDLTPGDYKLVSIVASCPTCSTNFTPLTITTTVAPNGLESATQAGELDIYAVNANGKPVQGAAITVVNASVTPTINLTDTTNASGILQIVGVPTSTNGYQITATKAGYSTERTYPPGAPSNPNPVKPNASIILQIPTIITFAIDSLSTMNISTADNRCIPIGSIPVLVQGSKLIGVNPNIYKFSTSTKTDSGGNLTLQNLEWDAYALTLMTSTYDTAGVLPISPVTLNPSSTLNVRVILAPAADPSLLVTAEDASTNVGIANAVITVSSGGFSQTLTTGHSTLSQTDWSLGQYALQSGGIDTTSTPGSLTLRVNASGTYETSTTEWLDSNTFDVGGASSTFYSLNWTPVSQPPSAGAGSLELQVAANNDNATWNFVGPDGTASTFFTSTGTLPSALSGNRYFRYKVFMSTADPAVTPQLDSVSVDFYANCVPPAQALFTNLPTGNYEIDATAPNYALASTSLSIGSGFQSSTLMLTHL